MEGVQIIAGFFLFVFFDVGFELRGGTQVTSIQVAQKYTCPVKCDMSVCSECQVIAHCVWIDEIQATLGHSLPCLYYSERFKTWFIYLLHIQSCSFFTICNSVSLFLYHNFLG